MSITVSRFKQSLSQQQLRFLRFPVAVIPSFLFWSSNSTRTHIERRPSRSPSRQNSPTSFGSWLMEPADFSFLRFTISPTCRFYGSAVLRRGIKSARRPILPPRHDGFNHGSSSPAPCGLSRLAQGTAGIADPGPYASVLYQAAGPLSRAVDGGRALGISSH